MSTNIKTVSVVILYMSDQHINSLSRWWAGWGSIILHCCLKIRERKKQRNKKQRIFHISASCMAWASGHLTSLKPPWVRMLVLWRVCLSFCLFTFLNTEHIPSRCFPSVFIFPRPQLHFVSWCCRPSAVWWKPQSFRYNKRDGMCMASYYYIMWVMIERERGGGGYRISVLADLLSMALNTAHIQFQALLKVKSNFQRDV